MKNAKIDFVIPWVNGSDPVWLAEKSKYDKEAGSDTEINTIERYRDWGLMKYWFRGVEKYAPWVNKIHFLTWGHVPAFLNVNHPKIHVVNHRDFIPADCLPLYNASAIEMVLHKIPDLSDNFVYFNDDTFLISSVSENDFFKNGLPCAYFEENPNYYYGNTNYGRQVYNALCVINRCFDKHEQIKKNFRKWFSQPFFSKPFFYTLFAAPWNVFVGFPSPHLPSAFLKSTWLKVWERNGNLLNATLHSKFRKSENVQQELFRYWQFVEGSFEPQKIIGKYIRLTDEVVPEACEIISVGKYKEICLNDGSVTDFPKAMLLLANAFESKLFQKSSFEL